MTTLITWESDDSCPDCGALLVLLDDGATGGLECRSCGYSTCLASRPAGAEVSSDRDSQDDTGTADGHAAGP